MQIDEWLIKHLKNGNLIDDIDAKILQELMKDSRQSTQSIADKTKRSRPTVHERIKKLEEKGIIQSHSVKLNMVNCGLPLTAFILVGYDAAADKDSDQKMVAKLLSRLDFVMRVNIITGTHSFLVEIAIDYMHSLADVIIEQIRSIKGVGNTVTMVSFGEFRSGKMLKGRPAPNRK